MSIASKTVANDRRSNNTLRWIRQLHMWIGAWGALAAILYGFTGLVMNHRFGDSAWPQGTSTETERSMVAIPATARATAEELSLWLAQSHALEAQVIRKGSPGAKDAKPSNWTLSGGSASHSWSLEYMPGNESATLKRSSHTPLAAFNRLHKGVGGGWAWTLLADSFAVGMILLGLSGIWMWARGRTPRRMFLSVLGAAIVFLAVVAVPSLW